MGRTHWNGGITLAMLIFVLSAGIVLHLLSDEGRSSMKSQITPGGALAGKPLMDEVVPGSQKTATFAMG
jgi:hypothetical protein